jgi:hypothetical protein
MNLLQAFLNLFKDSRKRIKQAVQITQWLKQAVDSNIAFAIIDVIPGDKDAAFRDKTSKKLAEVLKYLQLVDNLTFMDKNTVLFLKSKQRATLLKAITAEMVHRDLGIDYKSAEDQSQLVYQTDKDFKK